nr:methyltransferase [Pontibaca methylaminivorans]
MIESFAEDALSRDGFLGGRLRLRQPCKGYRAGADPVLLAASIPARSGERVLDLGCGAGAAMLCLGARVPDLCLVGVEIQPAYAALARRNAAENGIPAMVHVADLSALPAPLRQAEFDHVIANPPYFRAGAHSRARDEGRALALGGGEELGAWVAAAARRLAARGCFHVIQRVARLPELLAACAQARLGSVELLPLSARAGREPELAILRARKGGRAAFRQHWPLVLHEGTHRTSREDYRPDIAAVLRDGAPLPWPA